MTSIDKLLLKTFVILLLLIVAMAYSVIINNQQAANINLSMPISSTPINTSMAIKSSTDELQPKNNEINKVNHTVNSDLLSEN